MQKYIIKLVNKQVIAKDTMIFYFKKPTGFETSSIQYCELGVIDTSYIDDKGPTRPMSIMSGYNEETIGFAMRIKNNAFKKTLSELNIGDSAFMVGPIGDFKLPDSTDIPLALIEGGIARAPILELVRLSTYNNTGHKIILFNTNSNPETAPFQDEFIELESRNPNFKFIQIYSNGDGDAKNFERGRMNSKILQKYIKDINKPLYFIDGPASMIYDMIDILKSLGVDESRVLKTKNEVVKS